ncbi:MAG: N-acetylneuraminic acid mutarotase, partial [Parvicellaceae bacterium]
MKFKILLFVFLFTFANAAIAQNPFTWTQLPNMPGKTANNSVSEGDVSGVRHIYSFGGIDTTKLYTGIHQNAFRYNTVIQIWDSIPSLPDTLGKIASGASTVNNIIYIFGGYHVLAGGSEV